MSSCNLDHDLEDVTKKLSEQKPYLPEDLFVASNQLLVQRPDQNTLNELFHLLKKYDLASEEEQTERNVGIKKITDR
jgi:hypothetical protein